MRFLTDEKFCVGRQKAALLQFLYLLEKNKRIKNNAVADNTNFIVMQNSRRNQMQNGFSSLDNQRMAGVIPALKAGYDIGFFRVKVNNFPFALIAPLSAYNCNISHDLFPKF